MELDYKEEHGDKQHSGYTGKINKHERTNKHERVLFFARLLLLLPLPPLLYNKEIFSLCLSRPDGAQAHSRGSRREKTTKAQTERNPRTRKRNKVGAWCNRKILKILTNVFPFQPGQQTTAGRTQIPRCS